MSVSTAKTTTAGTIRNRHPVAGAGSPGEPHSDDPIPAVLLGDARGVTEIRVHGVGGSTPGSILHDAAPHQVAGDRTAGFYRTPDRTPGQHLEAYSWGGLTSRSRTRALWVFLLPFMLANLAGWTSPPRQAAETSTSQGPVHGFRLAAAKWGALALTLSIMMTFALIVVDVVAYQCGAQAACISGASGLAPLRWGDLPDNPAHRMLFGAAVLLGFLGIFAALSYTTRQRYEAIEPPAAVTQTGPPTTPAASAAHLAGGLSHRDFWCGKQAHARLTRVHLAAGLSLVTTVLTICIMELDQVADDRTVAGLRLVALTCAGLTFVVAVGLLASDRTPTVGLPGPWPSAIVLGLGGLGFGAVAVAAWRQPPPPTSVGGQTPGITLAFNLVWVAIAALLLPLAFSTALGRRRRSPQDRDGIGWIPPFAALGLGIIVAQVVLLSLLIFIATRLSGDAPVRYDNLLVLNLSQGRQPMVLPPLVSLSTAYFVWAGLALVLLFAAAFAVSYWRAGRGAGLAAFLQGPSGADYAAEHATYTHMYRLAGGAAAWEYSATSNPDDAPGSGGTGPTAWTRRRARWEFLARSSRHVSWLVNTVVAAAGLIMLMVWFLEWGVRVDPPELAVEPAVAVALLIPPGLAGFIMVSWRSLGERRILGTLWDVGTFWPRSFHPWAPPCYAERAVPELTRRVWWLNDNAGEVVIAAHSQGAVIAAATALRHDLEVENKPRFALVTFGSPLRKLYHGAFPAYWPQHALEEIGQADTSLVVGGLLRNVYYLTDYIGGSMGIDGVDVRLADPASSVYVYGQPTPPVVSHTGYATDPRLGRIVSWMVAEQAQAASICGGDT